MGRELALASFLWIQVKDSGGMPLMVRGGDLLLGLTFVLLPAVLVALGGRFVYRWWRRRDQRASTSQRPSSVASLSEAESRPPRTAPQTPEEIAHVELQQARHLYNAGKTREFVETIDLLVRRFLGERYGIKVADATTSQILANLPQALSEGIVDHVGEILHTCDALRFSRYRPSRGELERLYRTTYELLEQYALSEEEEEEQPSENVDGSEEAEDPEEELREILQRYFPR